MAVEFNKEKLRELVLDSYELMLSLPSPEKKNNEYKIESRSKIKNLPEALREFTNPNSAVSHFVKSAAYFLPRAKSKKEEQMMMPFLDILLTNVKKIQDNEKDPEIIREKIRYLVGYNNWSMDAVCNIFTYTSHDNECRKRLKTMIDAELKILDAEDDSNVIVDKIMHWKAGSNRGRR